MTDQPSPPPSSTPISEPFPGGLRRFLFPGIFVISLFALLLYRRPPTPPKPAKALHTWHFRGFIFGTTYNIKVIQSEEKAPKTLHPALKKVMLDVDKQMSTYNKTSELSRFNASKQTTPFKVSKALTSVVAQAKEVTRATSGAFDVTIGPIINAWGFGPRKRIKPPSDEQLANARKNVGADKLQFDAKQNTIQKTVPGLYVDLSAIAKGYGVDAVGRALEKAGYQRYMVEIGGEVRARGYNIRGVFWRVAIEKPSKSRTAKRAIHLVVPLNQMSMATSGNYRNYITVNGKRITHIIDARTSKPITHNLASVTVLHPDCATADAYATALFVLGPKDGMTLATKQKLAAAFLVPKGTSYDTLSTQTFKDLLKKHK